jgi:hypothetical protein
VEQSPEVTQPVSVRAAEAAEVEHNRALAIGNGMFAPEDMGGLDDGLNGYPRCRRVLREPRL